MNWDLIFSFTNAVALLGWVVLAVWTRTPRTFALVLNLGVGLLCLTYFILFVLLFANLVDPGRIAGAAEPDLLDYSVAGLRPLFMSDGGIVIGWTHYLAFDLFVGAWEVRTARAEGIPHLLIIPALVLTFLFGPAGFLLFMVIRAVARQARPAEA